MAGVVCPKCGFAGKEELFADGCPKCGFSEKKGKRASGTEARAEKRRRRRAVADARSKADPTPLWAYVLGVSLVVAVAAALLFRG
jgi:predicted  nucleic acid-binding Zn-ribbon protein